MEYNTTRGLVTIQEYGRNIQEMIRYMCTIEDRDRRNKAARFIVGVMAQMHPGSKDSVDFKHKLWDHLHIISNFKLDVDSPYPPPPPLTNSTKPEHISYHDKEIEFRHYGKNIALIIEKAITYPDGPEKDALTHTIATHLKKTYLAWNRESVSDEQIEEHLKILSRGQLKLHEAHKLTTTSELLARNKPVIKKPFRPKQNNNNMGQRNRKKPQ
jgi:hypothetical protein